MYAIFHIMLIDVRLVLSSSDNHNSSSNACSFHLLDLTFFFFFVFFFSANGFEKERSIAVRSKVFLRSMDINTTIGAS